VSDAGDGCQLIDKLLPANERRGMNAQDQPRRRKRSLWLSLLFILALLMSLCFMLLCAQLVLSGEKQEWLEASMATKLRADYHEWVEVRHFAPLRPEVIDETAKDENALLAASGTGLVPVLIAAAGPGGLPFPSPSPTSLPVPTPQPSPTPHPSPTLPPTATTTPLPTSTATSSPTAAPTPTTPPTPTATTPPTPTPTSPPPTPTPPPPTPTSPPPPPPTSTPTLPAPIVYSISPDNDDTKSIVSITNLAGENFLSGATARIDNGITSIDLISVTVVSANQITGTLDLSTAAGGLWDVQVTNPDLQSGAAPNAFTVTIPITNSYPITPTCNISVTDCLSGTGAPDGDAAQINEGGVITLDFGPGNGIMDGRGYDFVFYEWYNAGCTCIELDWIEIELSEDGLTWYPVFNWGDGYNPPMDDYTNIVPYSQDGEGDNEQIPSASLYGTPPTPPNPSGILIDINFLLDPPGAQYRYVRLSCPDDGPGGDAGQIDGIERLN
jgi:hypothetical protein